MAFIEIENLTKRFGPVVAVDRLNLRVEDREFLTLLGPSGCGKTTVLRMMAGLEIPDEGEIRIAGEKVFSSQEGIFVPPAKRGVGLVFQSYALWPHMTVFENIAFGLYIQRIDKDDLKNRVTSALNYMRLEGLEKRFPQELSGGQQQRVALARMLVVSPSIFLMDEPLSNLDAKLRMEMRAEIKRLHRESKATTVYVTHDQTEALTLSTRVAVMDKGVLQQAASPGDIYKHPANLFVADFVGSPTINFVPGRILKTAEGVFFEGDTLRIPASSMEDFIGRKVIAAIRPEDVRLFKEAKGDLFPGEVYSVLPAGAEVFLQVRLGTLMLSVRAVDEPSAEVGDPAYLLIPADSMIFYDQESGILVSPPVEAAR